MELLDLYDENRRPLGRTIERGKRLKTGEYHLVAAIWTADRDGKLLLTRRAPEKEFFPNEWENSGGAVLAGETSLKGAVRELYEETGICVSEKDLILLGSCREEHLLVDTYLALIGEAEPPVTLQPGETAGFRWVTLTEYDRMAAAGKIIEPAVRQTAPLRKKMEQYITDRMISAR